MELLWLLESGEARLKFALFLVGKRSDKVTEAHRKLSVGRVPGNPGFGRRPTCEVLRGLVNEKLPKVMERLCEVVIFELRRETCVSENVPNGRKNVAQFTSLCLLSIRIVALNRLRHGLRSNFGSFVYFTRQTAGGTLLTARRPYGGSYMPT